MCGWDDPYDEPIWIRSHIPRLSHMHAEPVCAFPECETCLTREDMTAMRARDAGSPAAVSSAATGLADPRKASHE